MAEPEQARSQSRDDNVFADNQSHRKKLANREKELEQRSQALWLYGFLTALLTIAFAILIGRLGLVRE